MTGARNEADDDRFGKQNEDGKIWIEIPPPPEYLILCLQ